MDGAKYHVGRENPLATTANSRQEIEDWYRAQGIDLPSLAEGHQKPTKGELLAHLKMLNWDSKIASYEVANRHSHRVLETPPYHCELQPIERV